RDHIAAAQHEIRPQTFAQNCESGLGVTARRRSRQVARLAAHEIPGQDAHLLADRHLAGDLLGEYRTDPTALAVLRQVGEFHDSRGRTVAEKAARHALAPEECCADGSDENDGDNRGNTDAMTAQKLVAAIENMIAPRRYRFAGKIVVDVCGERSDARVA